ncbi:MAG: CHAP domain-containing protein [Phocaeicola sp.]
MRHRILLYLLLATCLLGGSYKLFDRYYLRTRYTVGQPLDSLNGVVVYHNGPTTNVIERSKTKDGYNLGLKYQCVEFVKRYYYQHLNHKMPDSYGHAKDFFDAKVADGKRNKRRNLIQYTNGSKSKPQVNDLLIYDGTESSKYGHVAIVSKVKKNKIEVIHQNTGIYGKTRKSYSLKEREGKWTIQSNRILGWLRKE